MGDNEGHVHVLILPKNLVKATKKEMVLMQRYYKQLKTREGASVCLSAISGVNSFFTAKWKICCRRDHCDGTFNEKRLNRTVYYGAEKKVVSSKTARVETVRKITFRFRGKDGGRLNI